MGPPPTTDCPVNLAHNRLHAHRQPGPSRHPCLEEKRHRVQRLRIITRTPFQVTKKDLKRRSDYIAVRQRIFNIILISIISVNRENISNFEQNLTIAAARRRLCPRRGHKRCTFSASFPRYCHRRHIRPVSDLYHSKNRTHHCDNQFYSFSPISHVKSFLACSCYN